jgi:hypothetical protein
MNFGSCKKGEEEKRRDEEKDKEIMANFGCFAHYVSLEKLNGGKLSTGVISISNYLPAVLILCLLSSLFFSFLFFSVLCFRFRRFASSCLFVFSFVDNDSGVFLA